MIQKQRHSAWILVLALLFLLDLLYFGSKYRENSYGRSDFACFYAAGHILAHEGGSRLYNYDVQLATQRTLLPRTDRAVFDGLPYVIFNHAPYEALLFVPFSKFPFPVAHLAWLAAKLLLFILACAALLRQFDQLHGQRDWLLLGVLCYPAAVDLVVGQDSLLVFCIYVLAFLSFQQGKFLQAGAWLALGLFKFHLVLPFLPVFLRKGRRQGFAGFCLIAALLLALSLAIVGTGGAAQYSTLLRGTAAGVWRNVPNLHGLVFMSLRNSVSAIKLNIASAAISLLLMLTLAAVEPFDKLRAGSRHETTSQGELQAVFSLYLLSALLASYHAYLYDLVLILPAIFVIANEASRRWGQCPLRLLVPFWLLLTPPLYILGFGSWMALPLLPLTYYLAVLLRGEKIRLVSATAEA